MKLDKENINLRNGIQKEWLITNGLGGYSSSTIVGANTRRYHGLLVVPFVSPSNRTLILSKLDESLEIGSKKYDLYTNIGKEYISHGYKYLESFQKEILPVFKYKVSDVSISKTICMQYGKNTVQVFYKVRTGKNKVKLTLAPVMNFRDFHSMSTNHSFWVEQKNEDKKIKLIIDGNATNPVYMKITDGKYIEHFNDTFSNMLYIEEEKRGFFPEENHVVPGRFEIEIGANEEKEISFICSLEENIDEINPKELINNEIIRQSELFNKSLLIDNKKMKKTKKEIEEDELKKTFLTAIDNFIIYRPIFGLHTVIAGYPWFQDMVRDTLISFEGLFLKTKRFEEAKEILLTVTRDIKYGLIPNGYSDVDNSPIYNSADNSLLLFEQAQKYVDYTEDYDFVKTNIYPKLKTIIESYVQGISFSNNNIYLDEDGLIYSGDENTQNTWMNAKYENFVATPRYGKVVEINAMWYNALMIMSRFTKKFKIIGKRLECKKYEEMAEKCRLSFIEKFYNSKKKCLYDYIDDSKEKVEKNVQIRPNQLFALSLSYPVIAPVSEIGENIVKIIEKKLLNSYGLKTLAKGEENYIDIYEGDTFKREMSYHQGLTWTWLIGLYYDALMNLKVDVDIIEKKREIEEKIEKFREKIYKIFKKEIYERGVVGSISEMYDSRTPYEPKGALAMAVSVAEIFRILF